MTRMPKPARPAQNKPKGLTLQQWLADPTAAATRQQVYLVTKLVVQTAIDVEREQAKYRRWHRRLWAALQRLFAPAQVTTNVGNTPIAGEAGPDQPGEDGEAGDPRTAELAAQKDVPLEQLESGVQFRDKRGER